MERWRLTISVLSICVAASALASCAASPSSPASSVAPADRPSERSWMLPEASGDTLLYVTSDFGGVNVLSYPSGKLVGTLSGVEYPIGVCADSGGNVSSPRITRRRSSSTRTAGRRRSHDFPTSAIIHAAARSIR